MTLREVCVPLRRLNIDVTEDAFETPDVSDLDHVPGCERVTEIVEANLGNLRRAYQLGKVVAR